MIFFPSLARSQILFEVGAGSHSLYLGFKLYLSLYKGENIYAQWLVRARLYDNNLIPKHSYAELLLAPKVAFTSSPSLKIPLSYASYEWNFFAEKEFFIRYNFFIDTRKTSQTTGMLAIRLNRWAFVFDNDVLAFTGEDRFRTGAFAFVYYLPRKEISLKYISFTGDQRYGKLHPPSSEYPREYKDLSEAPYGKYSAGILCAEVNYFAKQIPYVRFGIDDERIRHFFQNKLIHDAPVIRNNNVHYPPLDIYGKPKISFAQSLRPSRFYFETGTMSYFLY